MTDVTNPKDRLATQLAAKVVFGEKGLKRLKDNKCPSCGFDHGQRPEVHFRDSLSLKEWSISGLCQNCQDNTFGKD